MSVHPQASGLWGLPGSLLWLPTAVNAVLLSELLLNAWDRPAQWQMEVGMHIWAFSVPLAIVLFIGVCVFAALRMRVPPDPARASGGSAQLLLAINVAAPVVLIGLLKGIG